MSQRADNLDVDPEAITRALHAANNMVVLTDPRQDDNPIVWVNDHFCDFTGYERAEVIGRNCRFLQGDDRDQPQRYAMREATDRGERFNVMLRNYRKDGSLFYNDLYVSPVHDDDGALVYFIGVQNDVTAREEARATVLDREREIQETAENERERFGMDLHDGLGQVLSGVRMMAEVLRRDLADAGLPYAGAAQDLVDYIADAQQESKRMARGLNPVDASPEGLGDALRMLAQRAEASAGDGIEVVARVEPVDFQDRREARHLYRIAQEALSNALRHAQPSRIVLTLHRSPRSVQLEVNDDGVGIPDDLAERVNRQGQNGVEQLSESGMGLFGMRFRAELIGARLRVVHREGGGTVVRVTLPHRRTAPRQHTRTAE